MLCRGNAMGAYKYDIALSFAGEDRAYVEQVADALSQRGIRTFYDRYEEADLWGKDLYAHLRDVYANQAAFTVVFVSCHYASKLWTSHERSSAQARAFEERREYILPARFDDAQIPGILPTVGYIDLRSKKPEQFADIIQVKLASSLAEYVPAKHWDLGSCDNSCPSDAVVLQIGSGKEARRVAFMPSAYKTFSELLDDLFLNYLCDRVPAFSYGSAWVLTTGRSGRVHVPIEWIASDCRAICRSWPHWYASQTPLQAGLEVGTFWEVFGLDENSHGLRWEAGARWIAAGRKYYGLLTNNSDLAELVANYPKAAAFLAGGELRQFEFRTVDQSAGEAHLFRYVLPDWLDIAPGKVLVDKGELVPDQYLRLFSHGRLPRR